MAPAEATERRLESLDGAAAPHVITVELYNGVPSSKKTLENPHFRGAFFSDFASGLRGESSFRGSTPCRTRDFPRLFRVFASAYAGSHPERNEDATPRIAHEVEADIRIEPVARQNSTGSRSGSRIGENPSSIGARRASTASSDFGGVGERIRLSPSSRKTASSPGSSNAHGIRTP